MQCHFHFYVAFIVYTVQSQLNQFTSRMGIGGWCCICHAAVWALCLQPKGKKKNWTTQCMSKSINFFGVKNIWLLYQGYSVLICTPTDLWGFLCSSLPSLMFHMERFHMECLSLSFIVIGRSFFHFQFNGQRLIL